MNLRIAGRISDSIVDGPGLRYALFTQGCPRSCPGCHNAHTQDPNGGIEISVDSLIKEIKSDPLLDGVTFSGGEPFMQAEPLLELAKLVKAIGLHLIVYTGYTWEELIEARNIVWYELLKQVDVVVDGPFIQELRDWNITFAGSSNQRFIDVKASLESGRLIQLSKFTSLTK